MSSYDGDDRGIDADSDEFLYRVGELRELGVSEADARRLVDAMPRWRVKQAIKHKVATEFRKRKALHAQWLVNCLDDNWLPFELFSTFHPVGEDERGRRAGIAMTPEGRERLRLLDVALGSIGFWHWRFLAQRAANHNDDREWRRRCFENPTRSNLGLGFAVAGEWKRGALTGKAWREYAGRIRAAKCDPDDPNAGSSRPRPTARVNLADHPDAGQVRAVLFDRDDDESHLVWIADDGEAHVDPIPQMKVRFGEGNDWYERVPSMGACVTTLGSRTHHVGPTAAADQRWVNQLLGMLRDNWDRASDSRPPGTTKR